MTFREAAIILGAILAVAASSYRNGFDSGNAHGFRKGVEATIAEVDRLTRER